MFVVHFMLSISVCICTPTTRTWVLGASGVPEEEAQEQQGSHFSPMRSQSFINNQQRQLLHKLFMKGTAQQQVMLDGGQQGMLYPQQTGYPSMLQQSQQYEPQHQEQQQQQGMFSGQNMLPVFKSGRSDQAAAYHINAQAYDSVNYAQQQYGSNQMQSQYQHGVLTRGQSFALANVQPGGYTRGQSFANGQPGVLTRGQSFANGQISANPGMDGYAESPRLEVLVTPNFSSQELNMLLEVRYHEQRCSIMVPAMHMCCNLCTYKCLSESIGTYLVISCQA